MTVSAVIVMGVESPLRTESLDTTSTTHGDEGEEGGVALTTSYPL